MIRKTSGMCAVIFFALLGISSAGTVDDLKAKQAEIRTVSAQFTQEKHTKLLAKPIRSYGRFFFRQPDMVRWEYSGGVSMQVIYNSKELWLYYPQLKEADKLTGLQQYSSLMHLDVSSLSKDYDISARKEKNTSVLTFVPRTKGPMRSMEMEFTGQSSFPRMIRLTDSNGEDTVIAFSNVLLNPAIHEDLFRFVPEKGVTVRERSLR